MSGRLTFCEKCAGLAYFGKNENVDSDEDKGEEKSNIKDNFKKEEEKDIYLAIDEKKDAEVIEVRDWSDTIDDDRNEDTMIDR